MAVVLDAAHVQTATDQLGDELLDKGCLAGIMTPDDGDRGAGELDHAHILRAKKYSTRFPTHAPRTRPDPGIPCAPSNEVLMIDRFY